MNVIQRKKKKKDDKVPRRDRHRPKQRGETSKSAWDKIPQYAQEDEDKFSMPTNFF